MKKLMIAAVAVTTAVVAGAASWDGKFESLTITGKELGQKKENKPYSVQTVKEAGLYDVEKKVAYVWSTTDKFPVNTGKTKKKKGVDVPVYANMIVCADGRYIDGGFIPANGKIEGEIATKVPGFDPKKDKIGRFWNYGAFTGVAFGTATSASGSFTVKDGAYGTWKIAQDKTLASLQKKNPSAGLEDVFTKKKVELESNLGEEDYDLWVKAHLLLLK